MLISAFLLGYNFNLSAKTKTIEDIIYLDGSGGMLLNLDAIDYFQYGNRKLTFEGVLDTIVNNKKSEFINELRKFF